MQLRLVVISLNGEAVSRDSADDDDDCDEDGDEYFLPRHVGSEMREESIIDDLLVLKLVSLKVVDEAEKNKKNSSKFRCGVVYRSILHDVTFIIRGEKYQR